MMFGSPKLIVQPGMVIPSRPAGEHWATDSAPGSTMRFPLVVAVVVLVVEVCVDAEAFAARAAGPAAAGAAAAVARTAARAAAARPKRPGLSRGSWRSRLMAG